LIYVDSGLGAIARRLPLSSHALDCLRRRLLRHLVAVRAVIDKFGEDYRRKLSLIGCWLGMLNLTGRKLRTPNFFGRQLRGTNFIGYQLLEKQLAVPASPMSPSLALDYCDSPLPPSDRPETLVASGRLCANIQIALVHVQYAARRQGQL
jgi:hypothetical protein